MQSFTHRRASMNRVRLGHHGRRAAIAPRARRARRGAYLIEFTVCASVFFMTIFACLELARFMYVRQALDQTAYEAARTGVIVGASAADVEARAASLLQAYGISYMALDVSPQTIDETTREITVSVTCDFAANSWVALHFVSTTPLVSTVTLDHENQAYLVPADAANDDDLDTNHEPNDV